jgi:hypothetical protein
MSGVKMVIEISEYKKMKEANDELTAIMKMLMSALEREKENGRSV